MGQKEREQLFAEFHILSTLQHPNIVAYYYREHLKPQQELHLYMEYCSGGDLGTYIRGLHKNNEYAPESYVWSIYAQLVEALYRCHYGENAPDAGAEEPKGLRSKLMSKEQMNTYMILHRDLKPDNVFLGADNSVKLGDFGLSKLMQSHDFASTYVGTPYYMSPEILASERYTLQSDIWSLGCIMYELCSRVPPFNGNSYLELVQRIKVGQFPDVPAMYSPELSSVIKSCLKVNPDSRPTTRKLLNVPSIKVSRREREVVNLNNQLKAKEAALAIQVKEHSLKIATFQDERQKFRRDLDASLRREWEVKARLEIDKQVALEKERLLKEFDTVLNQRVHAEVQSFLDKHRRTSNSTQDSQSSTSTANTRSTAATSTSDDIPSPTPLETFLKNSTSSRRNPLSRSRTTAAVISTPGDVIMSEPSPMSIASLSLSPRRTGANKKSRTGASPPKNIFDAAAQARAKWEPENMSGSLILEQSDDDDDDMVPELPSPTDRVRRSNANAVDPFKPLSGAPLTKRQQPVPTTRTSMPARPGLKRQVTAPARKSGPQSGETLFTVNPDLDSNVAPKISDAALGRALKPASPNRLMVKHGFAGKDGSGSPVRKAPPRPSFARGKDKEELMRTVLSRNANGGAATNAGAVGGGRTLVELQQARLEAGIVEHDFATDTIEPPQEYDENRDEVAFWDPEVDEMPSPFLARGKVRSLRV